MARRVKKEDLAPFEPDEATPLDLYTPVHGNILAMMAEGRTAKTPRGRGESIQDDHLDSRQRRGRARTRAQRRRLIPHIISRLAIAANVRLRSYSVPIESAALT
jgi:hypothetical protein